MVESLKADVYSYLRECKSPLLTDMIQVVADVMLFTSAVGHDSFEKALAPFANSAAELAERPLVEVADVIVEHHLRSVAAGDRDLLRKSLLEAYFHAAGPKYVFEPVRKTRLVRSLRKIGPQKFAALVLSLHLFNVVSRGIQDEVRAKIQI